VETILWYYRSFFGILLILLQLCPIMGNFFCWGGNWEIKEIMALLSDIGFMLVWPRTCFFPILRKSIRRFVF